MPEVPKDKNFPISLVVLSFLSRYRGNRNLFDGARTILSGHAQYHFC